MLKNSSPTHIFKLTTKISSHQQHLVTSRRVASKLSALLKQIPDLSLRYFHIISNSLIQPTNVVLLDPSTSYPIGNSLC